eukprot:7947135-Pyramimonas_sp.AAC.2
MASFVQQSISANDPAKFKALTESLDFQQQAALHNIVQVRNKLRWQVGGEARHWVSWGEVDKGLVAQPVT